MEQIIRQEDTSLYEEFEHEEAISLYLKAIKEYKILTFSEEQELFRRISNGDDEAKEQFINSNLRLVVFVAKKYKTAHIELLDLIQEGNMGLLKAVEMFDYSKGFKFSTYATWWIRQAILRAIASKGELIRIPIHIQDRIRQYELIQEKFYAKNIRYATDIEISEEMKISIKEVIEMKSFIYKTFSLNMPISLENDLELGDFIEDTDLTPEEIVIKNSKREALEVLIENAKLTQTEEMVIRMRFDFENDEERTLEAISKELKLSKERIRMVEAKAIRKLRFYAMTKYKREFFM